MSTKGSKIGFCEREEYELQGLEIILVVVLDTKNVMTSLYGVSIRAQNTIPFPQKPLFSQ